MATYKATIERKDSLAVLQLSIKEVTLDIALTEDNPNEIKRVFNELLKQLKYGEIDFVLEDQTGDLHCQICREYIAQLNTELKGTYKELRDNGLLAAV